MIFNKKADSTDSSLDYMTIGFDYGISASTLAYTSLRWYTNSKTYSSVGIYINMNAYPNFSWSNGTSKLYGGNGDDIITGSTGITYLYGEAGNDTLTGGAGTNYLYGGAGNDYIKGGDYAISNYICGGAGKDTMVGSGSGGTIFWFANLSEIKGDNVSNYSDTDVLHFDVTSKVLIIFSYTLLLIVVAII